MLKSYLLTAYRIFAQEKKFAVITVAGLTVGLSLFTLISLFVTEEYSYDAQWRDAARIFRLTNELTNSPTVTPKYASVGYPAVPLLQQYFPDEIELAARRIDLTGTFRIGENVFRESAIALVEEDFVDIFPLVEVAGDLRGSLEQPGNIALREDTARTLFGTGEGEALGNTLTFGGVDLRVTAIYRLPAGPTTMQLRAMTAISAQLLPNLLTSATRLDSGVRANHYFKLRDGANVVAMNGRLPDFVDRFVQAELGDVFHLEFQNIQDVHFDPASGEEGGDEVQVRTFGLIAVLVLVVAVANFVILTSASAENRQREVGVRKVVGANGEQVVAQFTGESIMFTLIAMVFAVLLIELALPVFSAVTQQPVDFKVLAPAISVLLLLSALVVGIAGGLYPSLVLARCSAGKALRARGSLFSAGSMKVRNLMIGAQFVIAIALIIATFVIYLQLSFYRERALGFNPENLLVLALDDGRISPDSATRDELEPLINELKALPGVINVARSSRQANLGRGLSYGGTFTRENNGEVSVQTDGVLVDYDFFETYEMPIRAGRAFDRLLDEPEAAANNEDTMRGQISIVDRMVVNEVAASAFGFVNPDDAVGQIVRLDEEPIEIIGVVADNKFFSLDTETGPQNYNIGKRLMPFVNIRFQPSAAATIRDDVETVWQKVMGDEPLYSNFVSDNTALDLSRENNFGRLLAIFSLVSVVLACMGLYGLAAFTVARRIKEIGIRKVMGADKTSIVTLFAWQFSRPVLLANVVAWPLALWAIMTWLQRFPDQITYASLVPLFPLAGVIALLIAWLTVASTTARAASQKPVSALRYE